MTVEDVIAIVGASVTTGGAVGALLKVSVINPIQDVIAQVKETLNDLKTELKEIDAKRGVLKERIHDLEREQRAREERLKTIFHRLDDVESTSVRMEHRMTVLEQNAGYKYGRRESDLSHGGQAP